MGWRNLIITRKAKLKVKNSNLIIIQEDEIKIPIEDINTLMIESQSVQITSSLLSKLSEYNVIVYLCNEYHLPNSIILPFNKYSRQLKILKSQISMSEVYKKKLWKNIVIRKVENQALALKEMQKEYLNVKNIAKTIKSGDITNREGYAAKIYFKEMFGNAFNRRSDVLINGILNYGYAIIRGIVARSLVIYGFQPCLGIFHKNELNAFNLADDFIEPFRPIFDLYVKEKINVELDELTPKLKVEIYDFINHMVKIKGKKHNITNAIDIMVSSFISSIEEKEVNNIELPILISIERHKYE